MLSGVIVVVAAFLIFNTFSITVAQRIREFGLLRTLGAKRSQIMGSVVGEAALIGGLGTAAGVPGGFAAAAGLRALMKAIGIDLPSTGSVFLPRTAIVAIFIGLGVSLIAAITPALRATRVTPMAALLEAELPERKGRGRVLAVVAVLLAIGGHRAGVRRAVRRASSRPPRPPAMTGRRRRAGAVRGLAVLAAGW